MDLSWGFGFVSLDYELSVWALVGPQDFVRTLGLVLASSCVVRPLVGHGPSLGWTH